MAPMYSLYPSSSRQPRTTDQQSNGDPRPRVTNGRPSGLSSTGMSMRIPTVQVQDLNDATGEPLAEDFQDRYTTSPYVQGDKYHGQKGVFSPGNEQAPSSPNLSDHEIEAEAMPPPDFTGGRAIHLPTRTRYESIASQGLPRSHADSSNNHRLENQRVDRRRMPKQSHHTDNPSLPTTPETHVPGNWSSADSVMSQETSATSIHILPPLQTKGPQGEDPDRLEPLNEDDPRSFDLIASPDEQATGVYALESRSQQMLSSEHLRIIFADPKLLLRFTGYLNACRPGSIPILIYYLDALKAIRAISYANAIAEALEPIHGFDFTEQSAQPTANDALQQKADHAFNVLVREDLPAYVTHTWIQVVSISIQRRITGTLAPHLREASEGLAEVFCLSDPSRHDNPIVFASEEFARTTQYGLSYSIGRNCRFLQGPRTDSHGVRRLAEACKAGKQHSEVFVNYRRDGSPFMNLLMIAPLMDSKGVIRYYIGAQVDVSGLIKDATDLEGLQRLVERQADPEAAAEEDFENRKDGFQELSEMFNGAELETVRRTGGRMHKEYADDSDRDNIAFHARPRLMLKDPEQELVDRQRQGLQSTASSMGGQKATAKLNGQLQGVYQHYLLIRPAPSLRILFTSPSLRVPGILQSPFLHRIGGSSRVRADLAQALSEGRGVTAKIRWLTHADDEGEGEGRTRWIHCTPLLGHSGAVGVWMIVFVDEDGVVPGARRFRNAPPVSDTIGGKTYDAESMREKRRQAGRYDVSAQRRGENRSDGNARDYFPSAGSTTRKQSIPDGRPSSSMSNSRDDSASVHGSEFSFHLK